MSQFVWDPDVQLIRGEAYLEPQVVGDLLTALAVQDADREVQAEAVRAWLASRNEEVEPLIRAGLERLGLPATVTPDVAGPATSRVLKSRRSIVVVFKTASTEPATVWSNLLNSVQPERDPTPVA
jgi:hypothetical protein